MHKGGSGGGSYATVFTLGNKHLKLFISYKHIKEVKDRLGGTTSSSSVQNERRTYKIGWLYLVRQGRTVKPKREGGTWEGLWGEVWLRILVRSRSTKDRFHKWKTPSQKHAVISAHSVISVDLASLSLPLSMFMPLITFPSHKLTGWLERCWFHLKCPVVSNGRKRPPSWLLVFFNEVEADSYVWECFLFTARVIQRVGRGKPSFSNRAPTPDIFWQEAAGKSVAFNKLLQATSSLFLFFSAANGIL